MKKLKATKNQRENIVRGTPMFPCAGYYTNIEEHSTGEIPWHWHEELEFLTVIGGSCQIFSSSGQNVVCLREKESALINSNVLHRIQIAGEAGCQLISFVFEPSFVTGKEENIAYQKYLHPFLLCRLLEILPLEGGVDWQYELTAKAMEAFAAYSEKSYGYELEVQFVLAEICTKLIQKHQTLIHNFSAPISTDEERIKKMIAYIEQHFQHSISLEEIAQSASISQRECFRCFQKVLGETPTTYLINYRIQKATELLLHSNKNITEISYETGFNSPSYFTKLFREKTGKPPKAFQKKALRSF